MGSTKYVKMFPPNPLTLRSTVTDTESGHEGGGGSGPSFALATDRGAVAELPSSAQGYGGPFVAPAKGRSGVGRRAGIAVALVPLLFACTTETAVTVRRGEKLNPTRKGKPTPVRIRIHQLANRERFRAAGFEALWMDAKKALGEDLTAPPFDRDITPRGKGDPAEVAIPLGGEKHPPIHARTKYIGVVVLFTPPDLDPKMMNGWVKAVFLDRLKDHVFFLDKYTLEFRKR